MDSNKFLPRVLQAQEWLQEFVREQNADHERMVCAVGLDVHYGLKDPSTSRARAATPVSTRA